MNHDLINLMLKNYKNVGIKFSERIYIDMWHKQIQTNKRQNKHSTDDVTDTKALTFEL